MNHRIAVLIALLALAGCGGSSTTSPSTANAATSIITLDTPGGTAVPNTAVTLSTDIANNAPVNVLATQTTDANGQTTFSNIPASGVYCVSATIGQGATSTFVGQCVAPFPSAYTLN
jgi:hypothetical protein